ncbi:YkgJ family cysteine cluster protein [Sulfurospirillum sp. 1307]
MLDIIKEKGYEFSFDPNFCEGCGGKCCIGESGYIWVTPKEIESIANKLNLKKDDFINSYLDKVRYRYSIKEEVYKDGFRCVFFDTEKLQCSIYEVRPLQCRKFPFWEHFKTNIEEVKQECPGILV